MDTNVAQDTSNTPTNTSFNEQQEQQEQPDNVPSPSPNMVPDFRSLAKKQDGFATEIGTSDADQIKQKLEQAQQKEATPVKASSSGKKKKGGPPIIHTVGGYRVSKALPDDSRIGWTSLSNAQNPGGTLNIQALEKHLKIAKKLKQAASSDNVTPVDNDALFSRFVFNENWTDYGIIFIIGIGFWVLVKLRLGVGFIIFGLFSIGTYFMVNQQRFYVRSRDDMVRALANINLASSDPERANWLNSFLQKFWLIFEPVLSAYVIENIDTYLVDYLPGFLDSVRLTTFTLGSKPFMVESVKTLTDTGLDTICMDWTVSFKPNDTYGMTKAELDRKVNPKVVLNIRLGKGFVGTAFPVLVENMSFKGRMRVKLQLMSKMPHIRLVEVCFMEKPLFDYVLKPVGGETFGFDVNNIPGLQSFVRDQTHAILGPMMYYPNVFAFDVEKFFSGEMDISQANGVLAITVHKASKIQSGGETLNPFVRFFLNEAQELEKTSVCENTNSPHWNETRFILLNSLEAMLTMELRSSNNTKKSGKKLATATYDLKDLQELNENTIENKDVPLLRHGKLISNLNVDMRYFPVSKPIENPDGTMIEAAPSNSGVLRLTLHECRNLGYNNKVNPFANIAINGVDRFTTPTFKRTSNPKFERAYEILILDKTEVFIRIIFTDNIAFAEDTSLGIWTGYLHDIMEHQEENEYWWNLKSRTGKPRMRMSVQWKPVVMTGLTKLGASSGGASLYSTPQGVVRFSFWNAKNLPSGNNNPYVRVRSGNQIRARTESLDNAQNPEWGEHHYVPIHSIQENLVLEVVDWSTGSKDKLLGSTVFELKDLVRMCEEEGKGTWLEAITDNLEKNAPLSQSGSSQRGTLRYSAQFFPTMQLPDDDDSDDSDDEEEPAVVEKGKSTSPKSATSPVSPTFDQTTPAAIGSPKHEQVAKHLPATDLHGLPLRYTPDGLVDLSSCSSGVVTVRIHEVKLATVTEAYCQILVDSLQSQYKTATLKGRTLAFNEISDAFIKDVGFSRVAIVVKPATSKGSEKDDDQLGYWYDSSDHIIKAIQHRKRMALQEGTELKTIDQSEGEWYDLINAVGGSGKIRLSFDYVPLLNYTVDPNESLENQGILRVTLLSAKNLKAADKSGTSDPYVKFIINGKLEKTSERVDKTLNPVWKGCTFEVPIISRVTASFRVEVFDWNRMGGDEPLGSGGLTLRGDMVESFMARDYDIPLDGVAGVTGSVRVRLKWDPQLLLRTKTHSTFMGVTKRMTTKMGTTAFNWGEKPINRTATSKSSSPANIMRSPTSSSLSSPQQVSSPPLPSLPPSATASPVGKKASPPPPLPSSPLVQSVKESSPPIPPPSVSPPAAATSVAAVNTPSPPPVATPVSAVNTPSPPPVATPVAAVNTPSPPLPATPVAVAAVTSPSPPPVATPVSAVNTPSPPLPATPVAAAVNSPSPPPATASPALNDLINKPSPPLPPLSPTAVGDSSVANTPSPPPAAASVSPPVAAETEAPTETAAFSSESLTGSQNTSSSFGVITLHIIEARGLKGKVNPVVHVHLGNLSTYKTKKVKKSANPEWNEMVKTKGDCHSPVTLSLSVKDSHTFHTGDLGQWSSDVWDLIHPPTVNSVDRWLPLKPEGSGEIHIRIDFEPLR